MLARIFNALPMFSYEVAKRAGVSERTARAALVIATVGDYFVPVMFSAAVVVTATIIRPAPPVEEVGVAEEEAHQPRSITRSMYSGEMQTSRLTVALIPTGNLSPLMRPQHTKYRPFPLPAAISSSSGKPIQEA